MKDFHVCGLGNAIVDIFLELSDEEFAALGFERATMRLVEPPEQRQLLERFQSRQPPLVSGGSVANSIIALSQLGGQAAFLGCVGDDRYGLFYQNEFEDLGIDIGNPVIVGATTGTCLCVITPDAERTMRTCLAVSSQLSARHVEERRVRDSEWLFIEGYVFANPANGQGAIRESIRLAKRYGVKVALTCSEAFIVNVFGEPFLAALAEADLLFCNASEACAATGATTAADAFAKLKDRVPSAVVTDGPHGAYVRHDGVEAHVPAVPCEPKDLTGAGDMFAGALPGTVTIHARRRASDRAARAACYLARGRLSPRSGCWPPAPRHPPILGPGTGHAMSRLRTFIAVDPGKTIRARLVSLQESLARAGSAMKWVEPENLHVTLLFLGEVDNRNVPDVCRAVSACCREIEAFEMTVGGVDCFGSPRRPRTVWAGLIEGGPELVALHDAAPGAAAARLGLLSALKIRPFTPHITLGRVKGERNDDALAAALPKYETWAGGHRRGARSAGDEQRTSFGKTAAAVCRAEPRQAALCPRKPLLGPNADTNGETEE